MQKQASSHFRLVQTIRDERFFAMLEAPTPMVMALDSQIQCGLYRMNQDLGSDPDRFLAALRSKLGIDGEVKYHCANWYANFVEHCIVIGSAANESGWGLLLKCECQFEPDVPAQGWVCLVEGTDAAQHLCDSLEQETLRLVALGIERSLQSTTLPLTYDRMVALRLMFAESSLGKQLLRAWDAHARNRALEAALPPATVARGRGPRL